MQNADTMATVVIRRFVLMTMDVRIRTIVSASPTSSHGVRVPKLQLAVDAQPVPRLTRLTKRDLNIAKELTLRGSRFCFFEVRADGRSGPQQLIDKRPDARARREAQSQSRHPASERKRSLTNIFG